MKMNLTEQIELVERMIRINKDYSVKDYLDALKSIKDKEAILSRWKEKARERNSQAILSRL